MEAKPFNKWQHLQNTTNVIPPRSSLECPSLLLLCQNTQFLAPQHASKSPTNPDQIWSTVLVNSLTSSCITILVVISQSMDQRRALVAPHVAETSHYLVTTLCSTEKEEIHGERSKHCIFVLSPKTWCMSCTWSRFAVRLGSSMFIVLIKKTELPSTTTLPPEGLDVARQGCWAANIVATGSETSRSTWRR